ncbi:MAG TPA: proprotein convertase P-domain-containing protein, partial [Saprospiraceae bacterium]|nr:proprotein convertase P-domain-containing protein [Saprospiraceae bacterium]
MLCTFLALGNVGAQTTVNFAAGTKNVSIPDGIYNGTLASMGTSTFTVAGVPTSNVMINSVSVTTNINHTWVGDVVIKLQAPNGTTLGLMSCPGLAEPVDDGNYCCGSSSDLISTNPIRFIDGAALSAESLGAAGSPIAATDAAPAPGSIAVPPANLAALTAALSNNVNGAWKIYVGDAVFGDAGTLVDATLNITYTAVDPCVLTCPANMTVNLDPGACDQTINYETKSSGNCLTLVQAPATITQNLNTTIIQDALDCGAIPTSQWRNYPALPGAFNITSIRMAAFFGGAVKAYVYRYTGPLNGATLDLAQMTLLGESANVNVTGQQFTNIPISVTVPANTNYVVRLQKVAGGPFAVAANYGGQTAPSYITCETVGIATPTNYANFGFGFIHVIQILNGTTAQLKPPVLVQTLGIASGGSFPRGVTKNCFELRNPDTQAKLAECCFDITVKEYPNPIKTLVCNDLVNFSVDANCTGTVTADQVLEGGPYGCYDDYIVELDKTAPFGNGPWVPAVVGPGDIGKTYQVRILDPENLNNKCWGNIKIEDKLPPVLTCPTYTVACNDQYTNPYIPSTIIITPQTTYSQLTKVNIVDNQTVTSTLNVPASGSILDVNLKIDIDHTWVGDLDVTLESPSGTQMKVWDNLCNLNDNLKATFDDEATLCSNLCADYNSNKTVKTINCLGLAPTNLSAFDGQNLNGNWKLIVNDNATGDQGVINEFSLIITYKSFFSGTTAATATDACSAVTLSFADTEKAGTCANGFIKTITRKWTATDASGNSTTCAQIINVARGTAADLVYPPDYDDIDAPAFACAGAYPTPEWIASQGKQGGISLYGDQFDGCSLNWSYVDTRINVCDGTYKIR